MEVHSRALNAEVGQGLAPSLAFAFHFGAQVALPGTHCTPVWLKSGPSLAKGSTKTAALGVK